MSANDEKIKRARARLAAREKAAAIKKRELAAARSAQHQANTRVTAKAVELHKANAAVAETKRTIKRLTQPPKPVARKAKGIDISNFQANVGFASVKRAGYSFVYAKATEGLGFVDPTFAAHVHNARAAGHKVGGYHFLRPRPGRTGADEAHAFIAELRQVGVGKGDLRPVLDVEVTSFARMAADVLEEGQGQMGCMYHEDSDAIVASTDAISATEFYVDSCVRAMRAAGYDPLIYTFPAFLRWGSTHGCDLWIANFGVSKPTIPTPWHSYAIWQYSSTARVAGVSGNCDVDSCPNLSKLIA